MREFIGSCLGTLIALAIFPYIKAFWMKKGENAATKQDIAEITGLTESAREPFTERHQERTHQSAEQIETLKFRNAMRAAALEKRLAVHQEAFALWRRLYAEVHDGEIGPLVQECQRWWSNNCLYLEPSARQAFSDAYWAAGLYRRYLNATNGDPAIVETINRNWAQIEKAGETILAAVALPGLTGLDKEHMRQSNAADTIPAAK